MRKRTDDGIRQLLEMDMPPYWRKVNATLVQEVIAAYRAWPPSAAFSADAGETGAGELAQQVVEFLLHHINQQHMQIAALHQRHAAFNQQYMPASGPEEQQQSILDYASDLGATSRQLRGDRRAFFRWFGHDAITDRYQHRHAIAELRLTFSLQRLGILAAYVVRTIGPTVGDTQLWPRLNLERTLRPLLAYEGDNRVSSAAFQCLATALQAMPHETQEGRVTENTLRNPASTFPFSAPP